MARGEQQQSRQEKAQIDYHHRQLRRNQIVFGILSAFIILSMLIGLISQ